MVTMEALRVHNALTVPLPDPPVVSGHYSRSAYMATDDEQISEATLLNSASQLQVSSQEGPHISSVCMLLLLLGVLCVTRN